MKSRNKIKRYASLNRFRDWHFENMANIVVAYMCWLLGGPWGLHHFYLGRDRQALVWFMSFGGLCLGWLRDIWRLPEYVYESNQDTRYLNEFRSRRHHRPKPAFSVVRFAGQFLIGKHLNNWQFIQLKINLITLPHYHLSVASIVLWLNCINVQDSMFHILTLIRKLRADTSEQPSEQAPTQTANYCVFIYRCFLYAWKFTEN